jgi:hypothetical protein
MKWLALLTLAILECSCTTLVNRRDLYSPEPAPDAREVARRMTTTTTTTTTTKTEMRGGVNPREDTPPEFR